MINNLSSLRFHKEISDLVLNQNCWLLIEKLSSTNKLQRFELAPTCELQKDSLTSYKIKQIQSGNDPNLIKIYDFLKKSFRPEELPSFDVFKQKIDGLDPSGKNRPQYRCFYVEEKNKNQPLKKDIVAVRMSEILPMETLSGNKTNKNIFYGLYIAVDKDCRSLGLGKELYISSLLDAIKISNQQQKEIYALIAECTPVSEYLMNSVGLKKIFFENQGVFTELPYFQPALEFDAETGKNTSPEIAEHLMLCHFDKNPTSKKILCDTIHSLMKHYENNYAVEYFKSPCALKAYRGYFENMRKNIFNHIIHQNGPIRLLSAKEKHILQENNYHFVTHSIADQR